MRIAELPLVHGVPPSPGIEIDVAKLRDELQRAVSGEVRFDRLSRALYSTDASVYQIVPLGVVIPKNDNDVLATVRACARFRVPVTARGGGTSQAGQAIGAGVQLDCSKYFNRILEVNAGERWVRVQPGCVLDDLNAEVKSFGLQFAPDISTSNRATVGGMIANNSSGTRSVIYGKTGDHVLELRVLLSDGSVIEMRGLDAEAWAEKCRLTDREGDCYRAVRRLAEANAEEIKRRFPNILRRVGGYNLDRFLPGGGPFNLSQMVVGSEGTLGIVMEAKLRLVPLPRARAVMVVQFNDLLEALATTPTILTHGPSAVEVLDKYILDSTRLNAEASRLRGFLQGDPNAILIIEFFAETAEELPPRLDAVESELRGRGSGDCFHRAADAEAQARIWKLRKAALGLSMAEKGDAKALSFVEDTAVAPERLHDYIAEFLALIERHGTRAGVYAHASVGCLHVRPVINLKTEDGVRRFEAIAGEVADLVLKYGGALSGEHGDGLVRSPFQEKMYGPALYAAFREIKRTFDPLNLFNPGKIVDSPPLTANLRYGPSYLTPDVPTTFDFSTDGGLARAAELCAGVGECRKRREGSMCPSYQATREEQHSTRGRANALRLVITGQLGDQGFTDPALFDALDLCLECKACKSECPTNVDVARLKAEFLDQYYRKHGLPLRNRFFGRIAEMCRWGHRLSPVSSWVARDGFFRWMNERFFGIDRRRVPPPFARLTFCQQFSASPFARGKDLARPVLLFPDTFTNFFEPGIGMATAELFHRSGRGVVIEPEPRRPGTGLLCCGRPMISNGMLAEAVSVAEHNVELLHPWAAAGRPIVACEPSCILTIKDDYPALVHREFREKAATVAAACRTVEDVLDEAVAGDGDGALRFQPRAGQFLVQAHCHQRSLVGMRSLMSLLRRIPGVDVIDLDAGCCGMAGSFGYEKEHYEVSRLVGEQRLFPSLSRGGADSVLVAPGFSCRRQIEHFVGRSALHPAELLLKSLDEATGAPYVSFRLEAK